MLKNYSLTGLGEIKTETESVSTDNTIKNASISILTSVSYFLAGVFILFLIAFEISNSISLTWFFLSESFALVLIPILAKHGYENTAKFLLIAYIDIAIIILSTVFGLEIMIQAFFIPAIGLSILLFESNKIYLRNIAIMVTIVSYFILDFIIYDRLYFSPEGFSIVKLSVLSAAFVTTWIMFNTFSEFKEKAERKTQELLEKEQELNKELSRNQLKLEENVLQLEKVKEELENSAKIKSIFFATMSHEIRTPMNAILGMTYLLKQNNPRKDQLEAVNILDFSGKTLLALIDDVLDFSKIEAGKIEFEKIEFELDTLISTIMESFRVTARNKGILLKNTIGNKIPNLLIGDPSRLTQILNNLINNALKFTEEGEVELNVRVLEESEHDVKIEFSVCDTGIGISKEKTDLIFESFTQGNDNTKRLFGGTGLGLTISKQLVELQGGTLRVESELGTGSTFFVELAFGKGVGNKKLDTDFVSSDNINHTIKGTRILLAEDNLVNQKVMQRFLEKWAINVTIVNNGKEAVEHIEKENYDLVLMDLQMPEMDGYEAATKIRLMHDSRKRNIPIIALTAAALKEVKENVYACGMNDFITKPFNPVDLEQKIAFYAQWHKKG